MLDKNLLYKKENLRKAWPLCTVQIPILVPHQNSSFQTKASFYQEVC